MKEGNTLSIVTVNMIDGNYANEYLSLNSLYV
jgi:hypothetical protein